MIKSKVLRTLKAVKSVMMRNFTPTKDDLYSKKESFDCTGKILRSFSRCTGCPQKIWSRVSETQPVHFIEDLYKLNLILGSENYGIGSFSQHF